MQTVDESVGFVQVSAQLGLLAVHVGNSSRRAAPISSLDDLDLPGHLFDVKAKFFEECSRLCGLGLGVVGHVGIVSSISNVRSPTWVLVSWR